MGVRDNGEILVVDDTPQTLQLLVTVLSGANYAVRPADSGALAMASIEASPPDLILLDVKMPQMSGFEVCRRLKQNPDTQEIPVIFLSGLSDLDDRVQGFQLGAVDFVTKPFQREELLARVKTHLELARLRSHLAEEVAKKTHALQSAYDELEKASRLKDEFLSTMSHELRTPLTAVIGLAEVLRTGAYGGMNQEQTEVLEVVETSGRRLLRMINDILEYAQLVAGQVTLQTMECAVADLVKSAMESVRSVADKKKILLDFPLTEPNGSVWLDPQIVKKILVVLLENAVKFTEAGGSAGIVIQSAAGKKMVEFEVWDTGCGIAEANMFRLFKPFVQLDAGIDRTHEGSGLGLALAQKLANLHGGEIRVTSKLGEGSRFCVSLPQARGEDE